jgi:hypothetical protein
VVDARNKAGAPGIRRTSIFVQHGDPLVPMRFQSILKSGLPEWNMPEIGASIWHTCGVKLPWKFPNPETSIDRFQDKLDFLSISMEIDMATGFGEAGKGPREMAKARYAKVSVIANFDVGGYKKVTVV